MYNEDLQLLNVTFLSVSYSVLDLSNLPVTSLNVVL